MNRQPARRRPRHVELERLALATIVLCAVFSAWPGIDLAVSRWFVTADGIFVGPRSGVVMAMYHAVPWIGRVLGIGGLLVCWLCWRGRHGLRLGRWRRLFALTLTLVLGTGVMVNGAFKEHWGRARPAAVAEFGGNAQFTPALRPGDECSTNCSFVSGHAATGFALMAGGLFARRTRHRRWMAFGMATGLLVGLGRIAQGGHFASDILFAGLLMWMSIATLRHAWLLLRALQRQRVARRLSARLGRGVERRYAP